MENSIKIFKALSDESRMRIFNLLLLTGREINGRKISLALNIPQYAVSKHTQILLNAGLIEKRRDAQSVNFSVSPFTKIRKVEFLKFFDSIFENSEKFREDLQRFKEMVEGEIER
ncbi:MAG: ArsR family transcriptional regulator [Candidatus Schekmanbacteria bacterium]|nr:MAG: ArsR family transcriptional regulator [Candidatus Schekmanbacteria bacterium]